MPKRKAASKISGLLGSDDEGFIQTTGNEVVPSSETRDDPPAKRRRGRPRISKETTTATKPTSQGKKNESTTTTVQPPEPRTTGRRRRPRGSGRTSETPEGGAQAAVIEEPGEEEITYEQENGDTLELNHHRVSKSTNLPASHLRGRAASSSKKLQIDGEFEYTPTSARQLSFQEQPRRSAEVSPHSRTSQRRRNEPKQPQEDDNPVADMVDESILPNDQFPTDKTRQSAVRNTRAPLSAIRNSQHFSPRKRKSGIDPDQGGEPELRRRIGDLTKKHDILESKYRNLRDIGIVEANTNMEKLRKQCESITTGMCS